MLKLDEVLDSNPTAENVAQMAETRIRNLQAFAELQSFNDTGKFLNRHPLLTRSSNYQTLKHLLKTNPAEFLQSYRREEDSVKRYRKYLKRQDREAYRSTDTELLNQHLEQLDLYKTLLEEQN